MARARDEVTDELERYRDATVPDVVAPGLRVLFCGINPSLASAARQCHFARAGNRFWPALHASGFTPRRLRPEENPTLLAHGLGITNVVARATRSAAELADGEYRDGVAALAAKCERFRPAWVAVLGVGAYRVGFNEPAATLGEQARRLGPSRVYVLPNPSGLNAHYTLARLTTLFRAFRELVEAAGA